VEAEAPDSIPRFEAQGPNQRSNSTTEKFEIALCGRLKELAATAFAAADEDASAVKGSRTPALA